MSGLYLDMISGISGDMTMAALLQIEDKSVELSEIFSNIFGIAVNIGLNKKYVNGIKAYQLKLNFSKERLPRRNFKTIREIIEDYSFDEKVKSDALRIFTLIAEAESKIHGVDIDDIHFHEVGAMDSIIDIVGVAYLINSINPGFIFSSPAKFGCGTIKSAHGMIPVPAPATIEILKDFPFERLNINTELTTPTGAAIIKHYVSEVTYNFSGVVEDIYYSTGTKQLISGSKLTKKANQLTFEEPVVISPTYPNLLRVIKYKDDNSKKKLVMIETNIDDMSSEHLGHTFDILFDKGALDIFFTPIFMKKNRPSYKLSVIAEESHKDLLIQTILRHTTTGGVRFYNIGRYELDKSFTEVEYLGCRFKIKILTGYGVKKYSPEWEDIRRYSEFLKIPTNQLYYEVMKIVDI
ncbi:LarC family nickel insertion protein [Calditerrivibrio nitroreducens]|uniref:LarC family nickel insertion protein n=1 Tax=Calditerrivibrio nitroreducens TaxID=477976 RepID=UPI003C71FFC7